MDLDRNTNPDVDGHANCERDAHAGSAELRSRFLPARRSRLGHERRGDGGSRLRQLDGNGDPNFAGADVAFVQSVEYQQGCGQLVLARDYRE